MHRHGLESVEREVRWLTELIETERTISSEATPPEQRRVDADAVLLHAQEDWDKWEVEMGVDIT